MKRIPLLLVLALCATATLRAEEHWSFKGTVVKMQMTQCVAKGGFKAAMSGLPARPEPCPEYTVMSPTVVYVVLGRNTEAFIPLAEALDFEVRNNEVLIKEGPKSRFVIQQMTLRGDWEREEERKELLVRTMERSVNYELRNPSRGTLSASAK